MYNLYLVDAFFKFILGENESCGCFDCSVAVITMIWLWQEASFLLYDKFSDSSQDSNNYHKEFPVICSICLIHFSLLMHPCHEFSIIQTVVSLFLCVYIERNFLYERRKSIVPIDIHFSGLQVDIYSNRAWECVTYFPQLLSSAATRSGHSSATCVPWGSVHIHIGTGKC